MSYKIEQIPGPILLIGEGPHWDVETQSLYFVNIFDNGEIFRYDYKENKTYRATIENEDVVSFIIPVEGEKNRYAVGVKNRVAVIHWDGRSSTVKVERIGLHVEQGKKTRFNDGKADPKGRLVSGTMQLGKISEKFEGRIGNMYSYSKTDPLQHLKDDCGVPNGLAWNQKTNKFYHIDTLDKAVKEYNYDISTGKVDMKKPRTVIDFNEMGHPDGMTIDTDGNLYVATFGGSSVLKINPETGAILMKIKMPCENVTSCAFGGPNLDILYVTTSNIQGKPDPAGATFKITELGAVGTEMQKLRI